MKVGTSPNNVPAATIWTFIVNVSSLIPHSQQLKIQRNETRNVNNESPDGSSRHIVWGCSFACMFLSQFILLLSYVIQDKQ